MEDLEALSVVAAYGIAIRHLCIVAAPSVVCRLQTNTLSEMTKKVVPKKIKKSKNQKNPFFDFLIFFSQLSIFGTFLKSKNQKNQKIKKLDFFDFLIF